MTDPRINLAVPAYGDVVAGGFFRSLIRSMHELDIIGGLHFIEDSLVSRARNNLVARFLATPFDWLMFIDADIIFTPQAMQTVYDFAIANGPGIYAGAYPQKCEARTLNCNPAVTAGDGWRRVAETGTGFMLIHRDVFTTMQRAFPNIAYAGDSNDGAGETKYDYFSVGVRGGRYLSEDWYFCQRWQECAGDVWAHTGLNLGHIGQFTYRA